LFRQSRIIEMVRQFTALVRAMAENADQAISTPSLLTDYARNLLPDPVASLDASWEGSIPAAVQDHAKRTPDRIAIVTADGAWTYRTLDQRCRTVAAALVGRGVGRGEIVAIVGRRCAELVAAVIGVLGAGAVFLILDPKYPPARLRRYLEIARPSGLIDLACDTTRDEAVADVVRSCALTCRVVSQGLPEAAMQVPLADVGPDSVACVSFTSGSAGTPKAVVCAHGSLSHFIPWQAREFLLIDADRFSMLSGLAHDPLQRDMFTPLYLGSTLCIPSTEEYAHPAKLLAWMRKAEVTVAHMTPGIVRLLTAEGGPSIDSLRLAFVVGDVFTGHDALRLEQLAPGVTCVSLYGTTETQRCVSYFVVPRQSGVFDATDGLDRTAPLPLGVGIPDVQLLVLTPQQRLAGIGEIGEICFRSPHLSKGYLSDETLTSIRFTCNPMTRDPADRVYRTGDLGRYRPDGRVEFLCRGDRQVKIRGHRIELAEIEATLAEHHAVIDAVVTTTAEPSGERRLVAYVVWRNGTAADAGHLRQFLAARVPDYMIPTAFIALSRLPLTPNGKVDRTMLPALADLSVLFGSVDMAETPIELALADIWREVLGVVALGRRDDFFELGGHSLAAMQIVSRIWRDLHVDLSVDTLFDAPTVADLAVAIAQTQTTDAIVGS
jgi:amino acid adenylation domain-containing protein